MQSSEQTQGGPKENSGRGEEDNHFGPCPPYDYWQQIPPPVEPCPPPLFYRPPPPPPPPFFPPPPPPPLFSPPPPPPPLFYCPLQETSDDVNVEALNGINAEIRIGSWQGRLSLPASHLILALVAVVFWGVYHLTRSSTERSTRNKPRKPRQQQRRHDSEQVVTHRRPEHASEELKLLSEQILQLTENQREHQGDVESTLKRLLHTQLSWKQLQDEQKRVARELLQASKDLAQLQMTQRHQIEELRMLMKPAKELPRGTQINDPSELSTQVRQDLVESISAERRSRQGSKGVQFTSMPSSRHLSVDSESGKSAKSVKPVQPLLQPTLTSQNGLEDEKDASRRGHQSSMRQQNRGAEPNSSSCSHLESAAAPESPPVARKDEVLHFPSDESPRIRMVLEDERPDSLLILDSYQQNADSDAELASTYGDADAAK